MSAIICAMKSEPLHKPKILVLFDIDGTLLIGRGSGRAATERAMMEVFGTVGKLADVPFGGKTDFFTLVEVLTPEGFTEAQIADTLPHYSTVVTRHMQDIIHSYDIHALPGTHELVNAVARSEEHTSELQSQFHLVCRLLLEK